MDPKPTTSTAGVRSLPTSAVDEASDTGPALLAELDELRRRVEDLQSRLDTARADAHPSADTRDSFGARRGRSTSRRRLLHLAGASAVGAVGGAIASGRPAAADDPNDVTRNVSNPVTDTTTLDGEFPGPVLSLFNRSGAETARALYTYSEGGTPTLRADNNGGADAIAVAGNAPSGVDVHASGSGRIRLDDHAFGGGNQYAAGELHQSGGTVYAMVTGAVRRVVAAPAAAGALFPIDPVRVYDSRLPVPFFGPLAAGQSRAVAVDAGRDRETGAVVSPGAVPADATAIAYTLTVVRTTGRGYLSVTPEPTAAPSASSINWWTDGLVMANSSIVGLGTGTNISVYCGGVGATDFIVDVVGYYR